MRRRRERNARGRRSVRVLGEGRRSPRKEEFDIAERPRKREDTSWKKETGALQWRDVPTIMQRM